MYVCSATRILSFHQHIYNVCASYNRRDEVCSAFVDVVDRENKRSSVQTSGAAEMITTYGEFSDGDGFNSRASAGSQVMSYLQ